MSSNNIVIKDIKPPMNSYKEGHYECYIKWGDKRKCGGVRQTRSYLG